MYVRTYVRIYIHKYIHTHKQNCMPSDVRTYLYDISCGNEPLLKFSIIENPISAVVEEGGALLFPFFLT